MVLVGHGGPERLEWRTDVPTPQLSDRPNDVLIRITAAGLNNTDVWTREGAYAAAPLDDAPASAQASWRGAMKFPRIQGGDIVGTVVDVGQSVDAGLRGRRVMVDPTLYVDPDGKSSIQSSLVGSEMDGGFAQYAAVPQSNIYPVDDACPLSDVQLAALPIAWITAEGMLNKARVGPGSRIIVTGASGGVGTAALVLAAKVRRATAIPLCSSSKLEALRQATGLPLEVALVRGNLGEDLATQLHSTGLRRTITAVLDLVAGQQVATLLDSLQDGGTYVVAGSVEGKQTTLDIRQLYMRELSIFGSVMGSRAEAHSIFQLADRGDIQPPIGSVWPLHELHKAQDEFQKRQNIGKIVVQP